MPVLPIVFGVVAPVVKRDDPLRDTAGCPCDLRKVWHVGATWRYSCQRRHTRIEIPTLFENTIAVFSVIARTSNAQRTKKSPRGVMLLAGSELSASGRLGTFRNDRKNIYRLQWCSYRQAANYLSSYRYFVEGGQNMR